MKKLLATTTLPFLLAAMSQAASFSNTNAAPLEWGFTGTGGTTPVVEGETTLFPSVVSLSGIDALESIIDVRVTLNNKTHAFAEDLEITLAFGGVVIDLMRDAGDSDPVAGSITFRSGAAPIPDNDLTGPYSGEYGVSVYPGDFSGRTTTAPAETDTVSGLAAFNGLSPNGDWSLYIFDDSDTSTGSTQGGWTLSVETETIPEPSSIAFLVAGASLLATRRRRR